MCCARNGRTGFHEQAPDDGERGRVLGLRWVEGAKDAIDDVVQNALEDGQEKVAAVQAPIHRADVLEERVQERELGVLEVGDAETSRVGEAATHSVELKGWGVNVNAGARAEWKRRQAHHSRRTPRLRPAVAILSACRQKRQEKKAAHLQGLDDPGNVVRVGDRDVSAKLRQCHLRLQLETSLGIDVRLKVLQLRHVVPLVRPEPGCGSGRRRLRGVLGGRLERLDLALQRCEFLITVLDLFEELLLALAVAGHGALGFGGAVERRCESLAVGLRGLRSFAPVLDLRLENRDLVSRLVKGIFRFKRGKESGRSRARVRRARSVLRARGALDTRFGHLGVF